MRRAADTNIDQPTVPDATKRRTSSTPPRQRPGHDELGHEASNYKAQSSGQVAGANNADYTQLQASITVGHIIPNAQRPELFQLRTIDVIRFAVSVVVL